MISFYVLLEALFVLSVVKAQEIVGRMLSGNVWQVIEKIQFEFFNPSNSYKSIKTI